MLQQLELTHTAALFSHLTSTGWSPLALARSKLLAISAHVLSTSQVPHQIKCYIPLGCDAVGGEPEKESGVQGDPGVHPQDLWEMGVN